MQCEFDTETSDDLRIHNERNIHDVINKNKSLGDNGNQMKEIGIDEKGNGFYLPSL